MPLQNRVTPEGEIIATPERGLVFGNRGGCFHGPDRTLRPRRWASHQWICCRLEFKGRRRSLMQPGLYTELFFLDEATAFAAGHRPCFECRREDATRFATLWAKVHGRDGRSAAPEMDSILQAERVTARGAKVTYEASFATLPSGTFVRFAGQACLLLGDRLARWTPGGYAHIAERPPGTPVTVLTPRTTVAVLAAGFRPALHPSAGMAV